jgi:hypothetical protein
VTAPRSLPRGAALLAAALSACGGNAELGPSPTPSTTATSPTGTTVAPPSPPPPRTLVRRGLFGDSAVANLLLDPTFESGEPGVGRWMINPTGQPPSVVQQAILSDSPAGVGLAAGVFQDVPANGAATARFSLTTQVPGGAGPFHVGVWVAVDPRENLPSPTSLVTVTFAQLWAENGTPTKVDVPLAAERTRRIGERTWYRYEGEAPGPNPIGSMLTITMKASRYRWYVQAPEVVPAPLVTQSLKIARPVARPLEAEDVELMRAYRRQKFPSVLPSVLPRRQRSMPTP